MAAVLNVADDHIGTDGIRDIEDLARIKGLVARAARKLLVLNGEDPRCVAMVDETEAEHICYVTMAADPGTLIKAHIAAGGMAVTLRPDDDCALIKFHDGGEVTRILPASDLPGAFDGKAMQRYVRGGAWPWHGGVNCGYSRRVIGPQAESPGHAETARFFYWLSISGDFGLRPQCR